MHEILALRSIHPTILWEEYFILEKKFLTFFNLETFGFTHDDKDFIHHAHLLQTLDTILDYMYHLHLGFTKALTDLTCNNHITLNIIFIIGQYHAHAKFWSDFGYTIKEKLNVYRNNFGIKSTTFSLI